MYEEILDLADLRVARILLVQELLLLGIVLALILDLLLLGLRLTGGQQGGIVAALQAPLEGVRCREIHPTWVRCPQLRAGAGGGIRRWLILHLSLSLDSPNLLNGVFHHFLGLLLHGRVGLQEQGLIHLLHESVKQHLPLLAVQNTPEQWLLHILALLGGAEAALARCVVPHHQSLLMSGR